jgi:hypothetical protein
MGCASTLRPHLMLPASTPNVDEEEGIPLKQGEGSLNNKTALPDLIRSMAGRVANDEAASSKIWSVYIGEAEKYDKALVESWRNNMDAILIFVRGYFVVEIQQLTDSPSRRVSTLQV